MWSEMWPDTPVDEVPIGHVTNGVHVETFMQPAVRNIVERVGGKGWETRFSTRRSGMPSWIASLTSSSSRSSSTSSARSGRPAAASRCAPPGKPAGHRVARALDKWHYDA